MEEQNLEEKTAENLELLKRSGFTFDREKHQVLHIYRRGKDWLLYDPREDMVMIEFYAANRESNDLSRRRNTKYLNLK